MLGRKQEPSLQFLQILDGLLMAASFWAAHRLRFFSGDSPIWGNKPIGPFEEFQWLLVVILPFGPIILELQGFYANPLEKTVGKSLGQIARTIFWLGLLIAAAAYFLELSIPSRAVMPLFVMIATSVLLVREHITSARLREPSP